MITLQRTHAKHPDFIKLVKELDDYLAIIDGEDHEFYHSYNTLENLNHVVVLYSNNNAVACGAFKIHDTITVEIKRMFVHPNFRGKKLATQVLNALEVWATELGHSTIILETGSRMPDAIAFYIKNGYLQIPNYGQYVAMENSRCFRKSIKIA